MAIARIWTCRADPKNAEAYQRVFRDKVLPTLDQIPGFLGAMLMQREIAVRSNTRSHALGLAGRDPQIRRRRHRAGEGRTGSRRGTHQLRQDRKALRDSGEGLVDDAVSSYECSPIA